LTEARRAHTKHIRIPHTVGKALGALRREFLITDRISIPLACDHAYDAAVTLEAVIELGTQLQTLKESETTLEELIDRLPLVQLSLDGMETKVVNLLSKASEDLHRISQGVSRIVSAFVGKDMRWVNCEDSRMTLVYRDKPRVFDAYEALSEMYVTRVEVPSRRHGLFVDDIEAFQRAVSEGVRALEEARLDPRRARILEEVRGRCMRAVDEVEKVLENHAGAVGRYEVWYL
jgi:hypothetical protein